MNRDITVSILLDFYGKLLTEKQVNALDLYYNMDYSLSEIAEHIGVTRQGVRAFIKMGEEHLYSLEEKLGMAKRYADIQSAAEKIAALSEKIENHEISVNIQTFVDDIFKANDMEL